MDEHSRYFAQVLSLFLFILHYQPDPAYNCHYEQERDLVYSLCARVCEFPG